jgi:tRNA-specific 2-thiouridylase
MGERLIVGMSGGVDSSVAAGLLARAGYEVIGCTMLVWSPPGVDMGFSDSCCGFAAAEDARRVAGCLGIRHYVLDLRDVFYRQVVENYVSEYRQGRTPNPCVRCNEFVKFDALWRKGEDLGARYIATGHYARREQSAETGAWQLCRARDRSKDQSYALYRLPQEQLSRSLFPLGEMRKAEVRQVAAEWGLPVAGKPDSQETCFVPDNDYPALIRLLAPETARPGPIVSSEGRTVGQHPGVAFYTIGQRKGLGALGEPWYVSAIDPASNQLTVCRADDPSLLHQRVRAADARWLMPRPPLRRMAVTAQIRYNMPERSGSLELSDSGDDESFQVTFDAPIRAVTPGQALVCYQEDRVVVGGVISGSE